MLLRGVILFRVFDLINSHLFRRRITKFIIRRMLLQHAHSHTMSRVEF